MAAGLRVVSRHSPMAPILPQNTQRCAQEENSIDIAIKFFDSALNLRHNKDRLLKQSVIKGRLTMDVCWEGAGQNCFNEDDDFTDSLDNPLLGYADSCGGWHEPPHRSVLPIALVSIRCGACLALCPYCARDYMDDAATLPVDRDSVQIALETLKAWMPAKQPLVMSDDLRLSIKRAELGLPLGDYVDDHALQLKVA